MSRGGQNVFDSYNTNPSGGNPTEAVLDVGTYTDTCYTEFLQLLHHPSWMIWTNHVHESKRMAILQRHRDMMRDKSEEL